MIAPVLKGWYITRTAQERECFLQLELQALGCFLVHSATNCSLNLNGSASSVCDSANPSPKSI